MFLKLIAETDVLLTNFTPGTLEGWELGDDVLMAANPQLIHATASTFGQHGDDAGRAGADIAAQAAGGLISMTGTGSGSDVIGVTIADHIGALNLVAAVSAALVARQRDGVGQRLEGSLLGGQVWAQASELTASSMLGRAAGPAHRGSSLIPGLYGVFDTADGAIALAGITAPDRPAFYDMIGAPELTEQFPQVLYLPEHKAELFPLISAAMRTRPTAEWCASFAEAGIRFAPVRSLAEVLADDGVWANGYLVNRDDPTPMPPVRFSATPRRDELGAAPELGQHTEEVLLELGYSWEDIAALSAANAI